MRALLLIPSVAKRDIESAVAADQHPRMDYFALADAIKQQPEWDVDLLDYASVEASPHRIVHIVWRVIGRDFALALIGFLGRRKYNTVFTNGENVGIPLALLFKLLARRPGHVTIGHRLSAPKKRLFFTLLRVHRQIDTIILYAGPQRDYPRDQLRIPECQLLLIPFHADTRFYRPLPEVPVDEKQICSAGLEWRDYPTLIEAVREMPELKVKLAVASPWSRHRDETANRELPPNVEVRRYNYQELRELYARSSFVVVPLYENDFQAGVTTLLEAMAMGKAVIVTQTTGQVNVIELGVNGLIVAPGDVEGWRRAIRSLIEDAQLRAQLEQNARAWAEEHATLDKWASRIAAEVRDVSQ